MSVFTIARPWARNGAQSDTTVVAEHTPTAPASARLDETIAILRSMTPAAREAALADMARRAGCKVSRRRARDVTSWRSQVAWAVRHFRQPGHPRADQIHPVARLAAVLLRRRFAVDAVAPCCRFERLIPRSGGSHVWCADCGTHYRRAI